MNPQDIRERIMEFMRSLGIPCELRGSIVIVQEMGSVEESNA